MHQTFQTLLQGVRLLESHTVAKDPLPLPWQQPTRPQKHAHQEMEFEEPPNREGEMGPARSRKRPRTMQPGPPESLLQYRS